MCSAAETDDMDRDEDAKANRGHGADLDAGGAGLDPRVRAAWRTWLSALATDAEAAMAAALAYESLPADGRDAWLDALDADAPTLRVPKIALYAPLLAVEGDGERRARIEIALGAGTDMSSGVEPFAPFVVSALRGVAPDGKHACVIVSPLYLDFVELLICRYTPHGGFVNVRHEPLRHVADAPRAGGEVDGVAVEETPLRVVVEELAHAVLADRRERRDTHPALASFAHLFAPNLDDGDRSE
jgi:hypothetical protein